MKYLLKCEDMTLFKFANLRQRENGWNQKGYPKLYIGTARGDIRSSSQLI